MKYQLLGKSGLRVSEICLGTMTFGTEWGIGTEIAESRRVFEAFAEQGGNFIDTANKYNEGSSERQLADLMGTERDKFVLATKYTMNMDAANPNSGGNHRRNLLLSVEASLRRLKTDYIDLYWLHMWDFTTPPEEVMRALDDLVRTGKILHIGASDTPAWIVSRCNAIAELRGWTAFSALQLKYNLIERSIEREYVPMARELDIALTAWAPLNYGILSGKYYVEDGLLKSSDNSARYGSNLAAFLNEQRTKVLAVLKDVAERNTKSMTQTAIRWCIERGALPIVGARTADQMLENLGCLGWELSSDDRKKLDEIGAPELGFPHDFLHNDGIRSRVFGDTFKKFNGLKL